MRTFAGPLSTSLNRFLLALGCWWVLLVAPAQSAGLVTIVDGDAVLIDGARAVVAAEGLKVADEVIVRTGARSRLVRVEWADGSVADFGPDTQAMLVPGALGGRGGKPPAVYLLHGWVKVASLGASAVAGLTAPRVELPPFKGAAVVMVAGVESWVFAETGAMLINERDIKPASSVNLKNGEVYLRDGPGKGAISPRPTPAQLQRVPQGFRDALPLRTAALKDRQVSARAAPAPTYAELRDWLLAEPALRKGMPRRFSERAKDPAFRASLTEQLGAHADWEPQLFPERFAKPAPKPSR